MAKVKVAAGKELVQDIDLEVRIRSSRVKLPELLDMIRLISDSIKQIRDIQLVEQTASTNQTHERTLITVVSKFQSPD